MGSQGVFMSYTTLVAGTTITSAWANTNVRDQTIANFASTTARDAAITAPTTGLWACTTDTNRLWQYNGTAWKLQAWGAAAGRPGVILTTTALSIPTGAVTDVTYATEVSDVDAWHVAASATCTVPTGADGWYTVSFAGKYAAAAGTSQGAQVLINGTSTYADVTSTLWNLTTISFTRLFIATDTIKVQAFQNSAGAVNMDARLEIAYLGQ